MGILDFCLPLSAGFPSNLRVWPANGFMLQTVLDGSGVVGLEVPTSLCSVLDLANIERAR